MDVGQIIYSTLTNPDVAYVLLIAGLFLAVFAFAVPGTGVTEITAGICLLLAVIGLSHWDVNLGGIILILIGIGLFIVDLKLQTFGLALGGAVALGVGSIFLIVPSPAQSNVSLWLIALVMLAAIGFFGFGMQRAVAAMRLRPKVDVKTIIGVRGVLRTSLLPSNQLTGTAQIGSELWTVRAGDSLPAGASIVVDRVDGLILYVSKTEAL
ncbi:MAG TPA: NfeD family protein [Anaerolineae bacterium]|jgi:membrane-bound serine protease (ClpP class)